jgi:cyclohexanone monooxygenase
MADVQQTQVGELDAVVIGAGFAGLYMLYRLRGLGLSVRVYEAGDGVGGTWYWNRYPGCRCDCPSIYYSYSFSPELDQEWEWAEKFPSQPEILRYLNHVADRFDLRRNIQFSTRVTAATYDEATGQWVIETDNGEQVRAAFCITAVGCLSAPNTPNLPGIEHFAGRIFHTGQWPHEPVDFTGRRVGVIGTGSTGIQIIPFIAQQAAHLIVFQRTPNYTLPARNAPLPKEELAQVKARYPQIREASRYSREGMDLRHLERDHSVLDATPEERQQTFEQGWALGSYVLMRLYRDLTATLEANRTIADFVRAKIRAIVQDPLTAERLTPYDHPLGSKRLPIDTDYYETYNRPNVSLVDVRAAPIEAITPNGLRTRDAEYELDDLIFATGFDAMTGPLVRIDIRGRGGLTLKQKWAAGPRTYLGLQTVGFPNLFTITGPGSPSVLTNMPAAIEQHVEWIADCVAYLRQQSFTTIEPTLAAEDAWVEHVNELASHTLYPLANSWYLGSNIPGKPRTFMPYVGGLGTYRKKCDAVAANGYEGFCLSGKLELGEW